MLVLRLLLLLPLLLPLLRLRLLLRRRRLLRSTLSLRLRLISTQSDGPHSINNGRNRYDSTKADHEHEK